MSKPKPNLARDRSHETSHSPEPPPESSTYRSLATDTAKQDSALCDDHHGALKSQETAWQGARFGGYEPVGQLLGEIRYCPVCGSNVVRLVRFNAALVDLLEHLTTPYRPSEVYIRSASVLMAWVQQNLPSQLGLVAFPRSSFQAAAIGIGAGHSHWREMGLELRRRREQAGLTRLQLSALSGVADSTIRNYESGTHRPTQSTLHRLAGVSALGADR